MCIRDSATAAAHTGAVYHDRIKGNDRLDTERLGRLTDKLHHGNRSDGNDNVILLTLFQLLLQHIGNKALCAIGAVVCAEIQVVTACTELVLQNDDVLVPEANNGKMCIRDSVLAASPSLAKFLLMFKSPFSVAV